MKPASIAVALSLAVVASSAFAAPCPTRASWPTTDWPATGTTNRSTQVKALEDYAFRTIGTDAERNGIRTDSVIIIKGGNIVYERYARGWAASNRHISWSVAKSISSTLIGVALQKGALKLEDSICKYLTRYEGKGVCDITVKDTITFGMGLQWQEEYENSGYQGSSVISMLLGVGHVDQADFVLTQRQSYKPGSQFIYSTGYATVTAAVAKAALAPAFGKDAFWSLLFDKIGMSRTVFEEDVKGTPLGGSYVYATPRAYAKLGYLYLNDGCWAGERLLPEGWVTAATTINDAFKANRGSCPYAAVEGTYVLPCEDTPSGYMWWLNKSPASGVAKPYPDMPDDGYTAIGHWGQYVAVVPSEDLVVVRTGDDRNDCPAGAAADQTVDGVPCNFDIGKLVGLAIQVAK